MRDYVSSTSPLGVALAWLFLVCQRTDKHRQGPFGRCENCGTIMNWDGQW